MQVLKSIPYLRDETWFWFVKRLLSARSTVHTLGLSNTYGYVAAGAISLEQSFIIDHLHLNSKATQMIFSFGDFKA